MDLLKKGVRGILKIIGTLIVAILVSFIILIGYSIIQLAIFGKGDYLLFVSHNLSIISIIMIIFAFEYYYSKLKEKTKNKKGVEKQKPSKFNKRIMLIIAIAFVAIIYIGMTSYTILYEDSIKVASPINPVGDVYKYSEINKVKVEVKKGIDGSYSVSYKVFFKQGGSAELIRGSMFEEKGGNKEDILLKLDEQLKAKAVEKESKKENFDKYADGMDKTFVSKIEKLFD